MRDISKLQIQHQALREIGGLIIGGMKGPSLYSACLRTLAGAYGSSSGALVFIDGLVEHAITVGKYFDEAKDDLLSILREDKALKEAGHLKELNLPNIPEGGAFAYMKTNGDFEGILCIGPPLSGREFREDDFQLLKLAAGELSLILLLEGKLESEKRLSFELKLYSLKLETLNEISLSLGELARQEEVAAKLLEHIVGLIDVRCGFVILLDKKQKPFLAGEFGLNVPPDRLLRSSRVKSALRGGEIIRAVSRNNIFSICGHTEAILVPLLNKGKNFGLMGLADREKRGGLRPFSEEDISVVKSVASVAAVAIQNGQLFTELSDEKLFSDSILSSVPVSVVTADSQGRLNSFNRHAQSRLGFNENTLGNPWRKIIKSSRLRMGSFLHDESVEVPSGEIRADITVSPFYSKAKDETGTIITLKDLTEEYRIRETFKKYVSDKVVDMLLKDLKHLQLGGEELEVTILFSDLRGFTPMSERMTPAEVVSTLNEYFEVMVDIVLRHEGTLDKLVGDEIMAVFGAPISRRDDADRAFACAQEMLRAMKEVNHRLKTRRLGQLYVGIGLNTGTVVSGNIGSSKHMDYTVIGNAVNLASRLCDKAGPGELLISDDAYNALKKREGIVPREPITVKGKKEPIKIYSWKEEN